MQAYMGKKIFNILVINASPRIGGNTDILLKEAIRGALEEGATIEYVALNKLAVKPCQGCDSAPSEGQCIFKDDMREIYNKVKTADALIIGSPIFFGSITGQLKNMIDRFQCVWYAKNILNKITGFESKKVCAFISVSAADRPDFFANAKFIVKHFCATINAFYSEELFCPNLEEKGEAGKHPELLQQAFTLGRKIASNK
ncbi:NADPH-dependent FMN reductase [Candidatus Omnitrophus magneticus]|uniref:NADPH-dependent FMN reductase n=1 Tax=Candidatus Omnitrophus magneticus TaxID=1609969 RepID=A0A0F0CQL1_9BACT|nr:NADPH-dependent FMN reductase [Candidatus Omnitrophus magneticus]